MFSETRDVVTGPLEFRILCPELVTKLREFFERVRQSELDSQFHPHPFTDAEAVRRANYEGKDIYLALLLNREIVGYGMLRGWDEGYDIPSLGIGLDPSVHGRGMGRLMMEFLHSSARVRGAKRIQLKVYADNIRAIALYRSLGYQFDGVQAGQLVGFKDL